MKELSILDFALGIALLYHWGEDCYRRSSRQREVKTFRVAAYDGAEFIKPWGSYSMAPIVRAK